MAEEELDPELDATVLRAVPGLARIAASAWWHTTEYAVGASARVGSRLMRAAAEGESPAEFFQETSVELRKFARRVLDIVDTEDKRRGVVEGLGLRYHEPEEESSAEALRRRGEELLRRSADVTYEEDEHPAYARILAELAPDEGRILRLLALEGPQPAVDVRTGGPLALISSELVADGLSMIGDEAGCRYMDRVKAYLNNLNRLGLIWFSREPVEDRHRYQVLEAQPEVIDAIQRTGRARTVRRSIHLTPFGEDFCQICLPLETAELEALPAQGPQAQAAPPKPPRPRPEPAPAG
jgi:Abortive infection alpha